MFDLSKKLIDIKYNSFRSLQSYFHDKNLSYARSKFKIRSKIVDKVPGNIKKIGINMTKLVWTGKVVKLNSHKITLPFVQQVRIWEKD